MQNKTHMRKNQRKPKFNPRHCTACWKCVDACPQKTIRKVSFLWHRHARPMHKDCIGCMKCVRICDNGCFSVP